MFHWHEIVCNGHLPVHFSFDIECLTSWAYTSYGKFRYLAHLSMPPIPWNTFQWGKQARIERKCHVLGLPLLRRKNWIMIRLHVYHQFLNQYVKCNWTRLNYGYDNQVLRAKRQGKHQQLPTRNKHYHNTCIHIVMTLASLPKNFVG